MRVPKRLVRWIEDRMLGVVRRPPDFVVGSPDDPYLERWWLIPRNRWFNVYLHHFCRSDDDRALHDHMYVNASLLMCGGYIEHLAGGRAVLRREGEVLFRQPTTAHRIELLPRGSGGTHACWTLFVTGPRVRNWGFHCPGGWIPWERFTDPANPGLSGPGCGEPG